ncbi:MAG: prepilin-type N-terminal cleavage/methylation domain-containing protein [Gemmatimonadaceae bacterium]|jgi:prepilin-type N-terminal cleavage/methylation domain-containing protein|nr:prepilin-type N-terminal cleavage/methylation domain-containing protein [Gemmatimonadaceae bacterium]
MSPRTARPRATSRARRGFTLVELLIAMLLGVVVLSAATGFALQTWQTRRGSGIRDVVDRNGRYIGMTVARDVQEAGVGIESTPSWGTLTTFNDTVAVLSVPYTGVDPAEVYRIAPPPPDTVNPLPYGGTCGMRCIDFFKEDNTFDIRVGDLARLQVNGERRLILVTAVANASPTTFRVTFAPMATLLGYKAGITDSLLLDRSGTSVQRMSVTAFWRDLASKRLMRASRLTTAGVLMGEPIADNVEQFTTSLIFVGGNEAPGADGFDADTTNDYNKVAALKVVARIKADRTDRSVNAGQPLERTYTWRVAPRNLMYERNRLN